MCSVSSRWICTKSQGFGSRSAVGASGLVGKPTSEAQKCFRLLSAFLRGPPPSPLQAMLGGVLWDLYLIAMVLDISKKCHGYIFPGCVITFVTVI